MNNIRKDMIEINAIFAKRMIHPRLINVGAEPGGGGDGDPLSTAAVKIILNLVDLIDEAKLLAMERK